MLQVVLTGKAQEVFTALSLEQANQYDVVKTTICNLMNLSQRGTANVLGIIESQASRPIFNLLERRRACLIGGVLPKT